MKNEAKTGFIFFLPTLLVFIILIIYPLFNAGWLSFRDVNWFTGTNVFNGIQNYVRLLGDSSFWNAMNNTFIWTIFSMIGQLIIAIAVALLLNTKFGNKPIFRSIFLFPWVMPTVVIALTWRCMFHEFWGVISYILYFFRITAERVNLLSLSSTSLWASIIVNIWRDVPLMMIMILAALQGIPKEIYESAEIDGSTSFKKHIYITFPMIRQIVGMLVLFRSIWVFNFFDLGWLLTRGGPSSSSETLPILIFRKSFGSYEFGDAASVAMVMFIILSILMGSYLHLLGDENDEKE